MANAKTGQATIMDKLVLIPLLLSFVMLARGKKPQDAFLIVFLPSLTLLPVYYDSKIVNNIPEIAFWSAALLPILGAWVVRGCPGYVFKKMDLVVLLYILVVFMAQWFNSDYKISQKILFNNTMAMLAPYVLIRAFVNDKATLFRFLKIATTLGAFVAVFNLYEMRMFTNIFDEALRRIWPHTVLWDTGFVMSRGGFKRAFGPFSHPIVAGYFYSLMAPLAFWCYSQGIYKTKNLGRWIVGLNALGVIASISRAPIIGLVLGILIIAYGWSQHKGTILTTVSILLSIGLMVSIPKFLTYASVTRATAETDAQQSVAYRKEMLEAYIDVVMKKPVVGWGRFGVPSVKGLKSIDNEYLGIALQSGLSSLFLYLVFLFGTLIALVKLGQRSHFRDSRSRLAWCLIACWVSAIFSQGTVYSGGQTVHYLFMLGAMGQNLINPASFSSGRMNISFPTGIVPSGRWTFKRIL